MDGSLICPPLPVFQPLNPCFEMTALAWFQSGSGGNLFCYRISIGWHQLRIGEQTVHIFVCGAYGVIAGLPTEAELGCYCKDKEVMMLEKKHY
jgi:hypothetical protein